MVVLNLFCKFFQWWGLSPVWKLFVSRLGANENDLLKGLTFYSINYLCSDFLNIEAKGCETLWLSKEMVASSPMDVFFEDIFDKTILLYLMGLSSKFDLNAFLL